MGPDGTAGKLPEHRHGQTLQSVQITSSLQTLPSVITQQHAIVHENCVR